MDTLTIILSLAAVWLVAFLAGGLPALLYLRRTSRQINERVAALDAKADALERTGREISELQSDVRTQFTRIKTLVDDAEATRELLKSADRLNSAFDATREALSRHRASIAEIMREEAAAAEETLETRLTQGAREVALQLRSELREGQGG